MPVWVCVRFLCLCFCFGCILQTFDLCWQLLSAQANEAAGRQPQKSNDHRHHTPTPSLGGGGPLLVSCVHLHLWMFKHSNLQQVAAKLKHNWKIHKASREIHKDETLFCVRVCVCVFVHVCVWYTATLMMANYYTAFCQYLPSKLKFWASPTSLNIDFKHLNTFSLDKCAKTVLVKYTNRGKRNKNLFYLPL